MKKNVYIILAVLLILSAVVYDIVKVYHFSHL